MLAKGLNSLANSSSSGIFLALKCPHGIYEAAKGCATILVDLEKGKPVARWGRKAEDLFKKR